MIRKELLKDIIVSNEEFIQRGVKKIVKREGISLPGKLNKVVILYGVRRSGKTYILFDLFKKYKKNALYIDFEDERLTEFGAKDFETLKESFFELKPHLVGKGTVFLLDEVQNVKGWEKFCRRSVEREKIKVFVSGSSSKMMPMEIHTAMRGREWSVEVTPFSFREFLSTKGIDASNERFIYTSKKAVVKKYFAEYLRWGGFPEVALLKSNFERKKVIGEYLEAMFFKDLVERFNIRNISLLKALKEKLFTSFATRLSLTAFYKQYKGKFPFSKDSLFSYYNHFLESMLIFEVRKFSESSYKRLRNPAKIYLIDTGLSKKVTSDDTGRILENVVFLNLRKGSNEIFYYSEKGECDFVVKDSSKFRVYQVTLELSDDNKHREIKGLVEACKKLNTKEGTILTFDEEDQMVEEGVKIEILPVWKYLLQ